jgi:hypothetical protein
MELKYNVTGSDRKRLVAAISEITEVPSKYLGAPTFAYEVDYFTIDKAGTLSFDDRADSDEVEMLVERLLEMGFEPEPDPNSPGEEDIASDDTLTVSDSGWGCPWDRLRDEEIEPPAYGTPEPEISGICISMPRSLFSETALANLKALVAAKGGLILKALGLAELPVEVTEDKVSFPWFIGQPTPEELKAYDHFICAICEMARNQKRITAKEKETDNDKYAFRCFLLRLGFIGAEYKEQRKILLRNLTGSSAFKGGVQDAVSE